MEVLEWVGVCGVMHRAYMETSLLILTAHPHPSARPEEGATKPPNCPSSKAEASCHGDVLCFPTVWLHLTSTKAGQMDTDLG